MINKGKKVYKKWSVDAVLRIDYFIPNFDFDFLGGVC